MATGTIILIDAPYESSIEPQRRIELSLIGCARQTRDLGYTIGNYDRAIQPPFDADHPFTFSILLDDEPRKVGKASYQDYCQLKYLVNRGWSLIGNDLVILPGELKERDQLERVKNIWGMAQSIYSQEDVA